MTRIEGITMNSNDTPLKQLQKNSEGVLLFNHRGFGAIIAIFQREALKG
jgi:hypothetical protein